MAIVQSGPSCMSELKLLNVQWMNRIKEVTAPWKMNAFFHYNGLLYQRARLILMAIAKLVEYLL
jgi:hypothetical protein